MADENIIIKVEDQVSTGPAAKLREIAAEARTAFSALERLQKELNSLNASGLQKITTQAKAATKALQDNALASQRLATEQQRTATQAQRLATEQQRTAQAATQVAEANARAQTAAQRLATEQNRTAKAFNDVGASADRASLAALRLQQAQAKAAGSGNAMERQAEALKRSLYPLYDAQQAHNEAVQRAFALYKAGAINVKTYTDAVNRSTEQLEAAKRGNDALESGLVKVGKGAELSRHHLLNLGFQLQDIGVSLASGQNPLVVLAQQGAQIAGIAGQAGVGLGTLARAAGAMLLPFLPLVAAVGAVVGGLQLLASETEKTAGLEKYARSLGLTSKEIKELDADTITFGDTLSGLWRTIDEKTGAGEFFSKIKDGAIKAFKNILGYAALTIQSLMALFSAGVDVLIEVWNRFPVGFKRPIAEAVNFGIESFERFVNFAIAGVNKIIDGLNTISAVKIDPFESIEFGRVSTEFQESSGKSLSQTFVDSYTTNLEQNKQATSQFISDWMKNTEQAAKDRIKKAVDEKNEGKADKAAESRAVALARVNAELSNEYDRLFMLKPEREAQAKFDQIEEQLLSKKIKLTQEEATAIKGKIKAIQDATIVQAEYDRIYEEATAPLREYTAVIEASRKLLDQGAISQQQYSQQLIKASETYRTAKDPLYQLNKELDEQLNLLNLLPGEREIEQQIMQISNDLLSKGVILSKEENEALREKLGLLQAVNAVSQEEANIYAQTVGARQQFLDQMQAIKNLRADSGSGFNSGDEARATAGLLEGMGINSDDLAVGMEARLSLYREYVDQLKALNEAKLISDQDYAAASMQIEIARQNFILDKAHGFFGNLAGLQRTGNKKLMAIGKAAAIAQAIIDTYKSANAAYAAMAGIPYVGPALGAAAAAGAIAAGMANVQAIQSQGEGFKVGGYTGNIGVNEVAGVVHGKEYVMDANSTARIGVDNLQALQSGAATVQNGPANKSGAASVNVGNQQPKAPDVKIPLTIVNVKSEEEARMYGQKDEQFILNTIEKYPTTVRRTIDQS